MFVFVYICECVIEYTPLCHYSMHLVLSPSQNLLRSERGLDHTWKHEALH